MISKKAEYSVRKDKLDEIKKAISEFVKAIKENESLTFYEAYQIDNSDNFVHIMSFQDKKSEEKHKNADYTIKFVSILYPNCIQKPIFTKITKINN